MKAIVLYHYKFTSKDGKLVNTTKIRVNLGEFGYLDLCTELANDFKILETINVELTYDDSRFKYLVSKVNK